MKISFLSIRPFHIFPPCFAIFSHGWKLILALLASKKQPHQHHPIHPPRRRLSNLPKGNLDIPQPTVISQNVLVPNGSSTREGVYIGAGNWIRHFDMETKTPYVWNKFTGEFVSYDDPVSISWKREWAAERGMGGMMVWTVG
jgi:Glycosyl hydrolases family 18